MVTGVMHPSQDHVRVDLEELSRTTLPDYNLKAALEAQLKLGGVTYIKQKKEQRVSGLGEGEHVNARDMDSEWGRDVMLRDVTHDVLLLIYIMYDIIEW